MKIAVPSMKRTLRIVFGTALAAAGLLWFLERTRGEWPEDPAERLALARERRMPEIEALFETAEVPYPPAQIYLRAFKEEGELELWARGPDDSTFTWVRTFEVKTRSGTIGPKRKEGDYQVPEGFYVVDRFNPKSSYHLSFGINYPNASDKIRASDPDDPGSDIFIHGGRWTLGCLPIGNAGIEALYLIALDTKDNGGRRMAAHIFPSRMEGEAWARLSEENPDHVAFWEELRPALEAFEDSRKVPTVRVEDDGRYVVSRD
jgi:murein L,D-transpeptidase YafK